MRTMGRLGLAATLALGCSFPDSPRAAVIAPYRGPLVGEEAAYIRGMHYNPVDRPLAWLASGEIVQAHQEAYSSYDVWASTCEGSGFYAVPKAPWPARRSARPILVGAPACYAGDDATVGPDGTWVVYSAGTRPNNSRLVRLDLATGRTDSLPTGCLVYLEAPALSRDGRWIAARGMCGSRDDAWGLYVMRADGSGLRRLTPHDSASAESPTWSPDARRIAYEQTWADVGRPSEIVIADLETGSRRVLTRGAAPSWSPDGEWIAFIADPDGAPTIRLIRPDGSGAREVFRNRRLSTYSRGWGPIREGRPSGSLVWSPDSKSLAFARYFDRGGSVWLVDVQSGRTAQVTAPAR